MDSEASDIDIEISDSISVGGEEYIEDDDEYTEDFDDRIVASKSSKRAARKREPKGVRASKRIRDKELTDEVDEEFDEDEEVLSPSKKRHLHTRSMDKRKVGTAVFESSDNEDTKTNDDVMDESNTEEEEEGLEEVLKLPKTYVHLYGKTETKPGRKMGHINVLANSREELLEKLNHIKTLVRVIA